MIITFGTLILFV